MKRGNSIIVILVAVSAFMFFIISIVFFAYTLIPGFVSPFAGQTMMSSATSNLETVDCAEAKIPKLYLPWIKQAAARFLEGDEVIILSVITHESNFNPVAMSDTGAVGISQFVADTANGVKSAGLFKGLTIIKVPRADKSARSLVTPTEKANFLKTYPYEGRLQPLPSIDALAYKVGNAIKKYGDLREGYAQGYHTLGKNGQHSVAAYSAADKIMSTYNKLKESGGCKELKDTPGTLGEELRKTGGLKK